MKNKPAIQIHSAKDLIDTLTNLCNDALEIENETIMLYSSLDDDQAENKNQLEGVSKKIASQALNLIDTIGEHLGTIQETIYSGNN